MRILHAVHTSLPFIAGYTIRSDYILTNLDRRGFDLAVVSSPQHPNGETLFDMVTRIPHWRTRRPRGPDISPLRELAGMWAFRRRLSGVVREWKPHLIHAHSPMLVGLPALSVARAAGVPLVYEIRDLWENASVDRGKFAVDSLPYRLSRGMENVLLRNARATVTICESLRSELAARVRSEDALHVVHNGVDVDVFTPRPQNPELGERWGLQGKRVVGYVGTFQPYEGLETLLQAMPRVLQDVPDARLAITGAGGVQAELERLTAALGLGSHVVFTGRVPHDQILDVYAQAEVMVYPRISTRTTRVTTPLKPLEAMAMGKPVVVSDVPAMQELVQPGQTGLTFPAGDAAALSATLITLLKDKDLRQRLGIQARADVVAKRHWPTLVARYVEIYEQALRS